jgi:hypothetical protein
VFMKLWKATVSIVNVCPYAWNNLSPNRWIFMKFYNGDIHWNLLRKFRLGSPFGTLGQLYLPQSLTLKTRSIRYRWQPFNGLFMWLSF